jgi:putative hydrolase of the HAD superfamily
VRALVLDYGNVLTLPQAPDIIAAMASKAGSTPDVFTRAYWEHRRGYDRGDYAAPEYWRRVLTSLGCTPDAHAEPDLLAWLTARDGESWMGYRDEMWDVAARARGLRVRTAMLSNMSRELEDSIRGHRPLERWFDAVIVSAAVRLVKPDPSIYRLCLDRLDVEPAQAVFVDDRPENIAAAAAAGMRTVHFQGDEQVAAVRAALDGSPR